MKRGLRRELPPKPCNPHDFMLHYSRKGGGDMKKAIFFFVTLTVALFLSACTVNWFGDTMEAPWYFVVIPIVLIAVFGYIKVMSKIYICPHCKTEFKAKPYQLYVTIHMGRKRAAKCPKCGRKSFCKIKK